MDILHTLGGDKHKRWIFIGNHLNQNIQWMFPNTNVV